MQTKDLIYQKKLVETKNADVLRILVPCQILVTVANSEKLERDCMFN